MTWCSASTLTQPPESAYFSWLGVLCFPNAAFHTQVSELSGPVSLGQQEWIIFVLLDRSYFSLLSSGHEVLLSFSPCTPPPPIPNPCPSLPEFRLVLCILWLYLHQRWEYLPPFLCTHLPKEVVIYSDHIPQLNPSELPMILRMMSNFSWACRIVQASTVRPSPHHLGCILATRLFSEGSSHFLPPLP